MYLFKISRKLDRSSRIFCVVLFVNTISFLALTMFAGPKEAVAKTKIRYCYGGAFKPCICASTLSKSIRYHPAEPACNGNAAILLRAPYLSLFSVVVRDNQNKDRWPPQGANGCSQELTDSKSPPARCSVFKVQRKLTRLINGKRERVNCLGAPGSSSLFANVQRITAKFNDVPDSFDDKIERWCIIRPECGMNLGTDVDCKKKGASSSLSVSSSSVGSRQSSSLP